MLRILIFGMNDNPGGIESFLMNYVRRLQGDEMRFDFLCNNETVAYEEELVSLGCSVTKITARSKNFLRYQRELKEFFREHASEYQILWVNVCSLANIDYLKAAKEYGIPRRIIHSHNSENMDSRMRGVLHERNRGKIREYATDFWSCSEEAGEWFYDEDIRKSPRYQIIRNAIDVDRYVFSEAERTARREELRVEDCTVLGNVGRLHFQKNQMFLLDIFHAYRKINERSCLWLIGQGEDEQKLRQHAAELGIEENVVFLGVRDDVPALLSAMDVFILPSLFEGVSLVSLEAQASGLPVIATESVMPEEICISGSICKLPLEDGADGWAQTIADACSRPKADRDDPGVKKSIREAFKKSGYSIEEEAERLRELLLQQ